MQGFKYSFLFQNATQARKIDIFQKAKNILFFVLFASLIGLFISVVSQNDVIFTIFIGLLFLSMTAYFVSIFLLNISVKKGLAQQKIVEDGSELTENIKSLNAKYKKHFTPKKDYVFVGLLIAFAVFLTLEIPLNVKSEEFGPLGLLAILFLTIAIVKKTLGNSFKTSKFIAESVQEISFIKVQRLKEKGLSDQQIEKKKNPYLNNVDANNFVKHIYPNPALLRKANKISFVLIVFAAISGAVSYFVMSAFDFSLVAVSITLISFVVFVNIIALITTLLTERVIKQQVEELEQQREKFKYNLELHKLLKKSRSLSAKFTFISLFAVCGLTTFALFGGIDALLIAYCIACGVWLVSIFVFSSILTSKQKEKQKAIVLLIEADMLTNCEENTTESTTEND